MIVGIAGKMGAGKDSIANVLVSKFGFIRRSMADALRDEVSLALAWRTAPPGAPEDIVEIIEHSHLPSSAVSAKPTVPSVRRLLQWHGTEHRRAQDPEYWTKRMRSWLWSWFSANNGHVVIPDIRFPNEAALVREFGGVLWIVRRAGADATRDPAAHSHISERFCDEYTNWDAGISNDGTLEDLELTVCGLMKCHQEIDRLREEFARPGSAGENLGRTLGSIDWHREIREIAHPKGVQ